jgi:hypothetical protein
MAHFLIFPNSIDNEKPILVSSKQSKLRLVAYNKVSGKDITYLDGDGKTLKAINEN